MTVLPLRMSGKGFGNLFKELAVSNERTLWLNSNTAHIEKD
jgi:hypothetical protein